MKSSTHDNLHTGLYVMLARWGTLPAAIQTELAQAFSRREYAKNTHLVHPGDALDEVFFVCGGLLRFYVIGDDGRESNKAFAAEEQLVGPFTEESPRWPAPYGIQALEDVTTLQAPMPDFRLLCDRHRELDHVLRRYVGALLERKVARLRSFQQQDASERYRDFLQQQPAIAARLPQHQIAAYLGITEVSLSRIRRNLNAASA